MNISEGQGNHAAYITCIGIPGEVKPPWNNYTMRLETKIISVSNEQIYYRDSFPKQRGINLEKNYLTVISLAVWLGRKLFSLSQQLVPS